MWSCIASYIVTDDSEKRAAYIFKEEEWEVFYPEEGGSTFLWNSDNDIPSYVASSHLSNLNSLITALAQQPVLIFYPLKLEINKVNGFQGEKP
jgi:hypothetical protein